MKTLIYLFLLISVCGYGQVIAEYNFVRTPVLPGNQSTTTPSSSLSPPWGVSVISRGGSIVATAANNSMNSNTWSKSTTFDGLSYYEFMITTPSSPGSYTISSFNLYMSRSSTGPQNIDIRYSIDNATETSVRTITLSNENTTLINSPSQGGIPQNSTLRIRIYAYNAGGTTNAGTLRLENSSSGSLFTSISASVLPVTYLYFNTKVVKEGISLDFATETEENNDFFEIERSNDGSSFETFDRLAAKANRSLGAKYQVTDRTPYSGINYYRIKQVDVDGKFSYSKISAIDFNSKIDFIVLNNRTLDAIEINSSKEAYDVQLYNTSGQMMKNLGGLSYNQTISLSDVSAGTYILRMVSGNEVVTERVVKM